MKLFIIGAISGIFLIGLSSCNPGDCFGGSGKNTYKEVLLNDYKRIVIEDLFEVYLVNDTVCKVEIETGEKLISDVKAEVSDSTLTLRNENTCRFARGYGDFPKITIHVKELEIMTVHEACDIFTIDTLRFWDAQFYFHADITNSQLCIDCNSAVFQMWADVTGDHVFKGRANGLAIIVIGYSEIDASQLQTHSAFVEWTSTGNLRINVSQSMKANLYSSGNVYYSGNPTIESNTKGTGQLIHED